MSDQRCYAPENLDEILALPETDERRRHSASCPRCWALLEEYRLYLEASPAAGAEAVDWAGAERELRSRVAHELGAPAPEAGAAPATEAERRSEGGSWVARLFHPAMRPAWGLAAIAVALGLVTLRLDLRTGSRDLVLRGGGTAGAVTVERAELGPGSVELGWRSVPGADAYRVRFFSAGELRELGHRDAGRDTTLRLEAGALPGVEGGRGALVIRVEALARGDVIASSPPQALRAAP